MPLACEYAPWLVGAVFLPIPVVATPAIRGTGDAFPAIVVTVIVAGGIISGPDIDIWINGGLGLGMKGAAIASTIAYIVSACVALGILTRERLFALPVYGRSLPKPMSKPLLVIAIPFL